MNKKKSKFIFACLILLILLVILWMYESKIINNEKLLKKMYGEPIAEDGKINNAYFGIEIDGRDAKKTLVGINKAIEYASKNNIENIKLEKALPIKIGDNCWFGANVSVMPGVTIGAGCVIAAGTVVTKDMPENSLIAGVPAKVIKTIEQ